MKATQRGRRSSFVTCRSPNVERRTSNASNAEQRTLNSERRTFRSVLSSVFSVLTSEFIGFCVLCSPLIVRADLYYLDQPTPVSLKHGEFMVSTRLQSGGGIMARAGIGLFDRLTLGLSYSIDNFFGADTPALAPLSAIGIQARLLGLDEGQYNPSILVGFESQGYDGYKSDSSRFVTLPPGPYLLLGKTFWGPRLDASIGANYWPGTPGGFDGHLALREFYFPDWDFIFEYDLALDDQPVSHVFPGLLNVAISRTINGNLYLKFGLRDILGCHRGNALNRVFDISFQQHF